MPAPRPITTGLFPTDGPPRLVLGRCGACGRTHFPAGPTCPFCSADGCTTVEGGERGRLWLHTVVAARPPGYRGPVPYGFGLVELQDGLRIVTRLTESDVTKLHEGQPMRLVIEPLVADDDGTPVLSYAYAPA